MHDDVPDSLVRAFADGELDVEQTAELERRMSADPDLAVRVRFERTLRERVGTVMNVSAPPEISDRVREALAGSRKTPDAVSGAPASAVPIEEPPRARGRSLFAPPPKANVFAVAASLALVCGAVLFGILGRQIDSVRPSLETLVTDVTRSVSAEHGRCAQVMANRDRKAVWRSDAELMSGLSRILNAPPPVIDLSGAGYRFVGAGPSPLPGEQLAVHFMYARPDRGQDGCPQALLSLFVVTDHGQFGADPRVPGQAWQWIKAGDHPECPKRVACARDGALVYFLVCCNERDLAELADVIAIQARRSPVRGR